MQVQLEPVAVPFPERRVIRRKPDDCLVVVDAGEKRTARCVQKSGERPDNHLFEDLVDPLLAAVPAQARLELQRLVLTRCDQRTHILLGVVQRVREPPGDELVHCRRQQTPAGRQEVDEAFRLPEGAVHRHRLRLQSAGLTLLDIRQIVGG